MPAPPTHEKSRPRRLPRWVCAVLGGFSWPRTHPFGLAEAFVRLLVLGFVLWLSWTVGQGSRWLQVTLSIAVLAMIRVFAVQLRINLCDRWAVSTYGRNPPRAFVGAFVNLIEVIVGFAIVFTAIDRLQEIPMFEPRLAGSWDALTRALPFATLPRATSAIAQAAIFAETLAFLIIYALVIAVIAGEIAGRAKVDRPRP